MTYIEESLSSGEEIRAIFTLHWINRVPMILWCLPLITLPVALYEYLRLRFTEHGLTNKRVIIKTGIISRQSQEMRLTSIETVVLNQSLLGRIFDYGDVHVTGRGLGDLVLSRVENPLEVKRQIESNCPAGGPTVVYQ